MLSTMIDFSTGPLDLSSHHFAQIASYLSAFHDRVQLDGVPDQPRRLCQMMLRVFDDAPSQVEPHLIRHDIFWDKGILSAVMSRPETMVGNDSTTSYADTLGERYNHQSFQNWESYVSESLSILRDWILGRSRTVASDIEGTDEASDEATFLPLHYDRIAEFIANLFLAEYVSLCRVAYTGTGDSLEVFGHFSRSDEARSSEWESTTSGSLEGLLAINAARENAAAYWPGWGSIPIVSPLRHRAAPAVTGVPQSILAVPITVHGLVWGAIEISMRGRGAFSAVARAKLYDTANLIGYILFRNNSIAISKRITATITNLNRTPEAKRDILGRNLADLFLTGKVAIILVRDISGVLDGDADDTARKIAADSEVFAQFGRDDLDQRVADHGVHPLSAFSSFARHGVDLHLSRIGDDDFLEFFSEVSRKEFYLSNAGKWHVVVRLQQTPDTKSQKLVVLVYDNLPEITVELINLFKYLVEFIRTLIETLSSQALWEQGLREAAGHELRRLRRQLIETNEKLMTTSYEVENIANRMTRNYAGAAADASEQLPRLARFQSAMRRFSTYMSDLRASEGSIEAIVSMMDQKRPIDDALEDPRLLWWKMMLERSEPKEIEPYDIWELVTYAFQGRGREFSRNRIMLPGRTVTGYPLTDAPKALLREIFSTLADNALKYSIAGTPIRFGVEEIGSAMRVRVSNQSGALGPEERRDIFSRGRRGRFAIGRDPTAGKGLGLFYARRLMQMLGGGLTHQQSEALPNRQPESGMPIVWHHFGVLIPSPFLVERTE